NFESTLNNNDIFFSRWYFTREQIENSPSRRAGLDPDKELSYRQQAANFIQDMGQRLNLYPLHRSFFRALAAARVTCLSSRSQTYVQQSQDLVALESIILQTLAFDITIDHPHSHVVKCTQLVRASKDLAQTSYFMATNSLHLTTFCLQYSPTVVACVCIHLACKWSNWEIPVSTDGKHWWEYVDSKVTLELLDELTHEFLQILEKTPNRLKRIRNWKAGGQTDKKPQVQEGSDKAETMMNMISMASSGSTLAGLMSLTAPPSDSSSSRDEQGATWQPAGKDLQQQSNHELQPTARVSLSLSEYRAKHADELAAQKKKLEHMEASVKREYATAAQALLSQHSSDPNNPSPIVLKIPLDERQGHSSLKMRLHPSSGQSQGHSSRGSGQDIKVRIRVPDRRGGGGSSEEGKSKEKHRERSNHHQHHHHHHHHSSSSGSISSSSSSAHKHSSSGSGSGSSKKAQSSDSMRTSSSSSSSSSSSRKRPHASEPSASSHPSKISKSSRNSYHLPPLNMPLAHSADMLPALGLAHHQESYSHSKGDKADTNGHSVAGGNQSNEYQDTFDMLNSLLSAQGVQPTQPPMFDYHSQYGEYRYGGGTQLPPLPSDPPPQLPPLPK
uniref:Cyclin T1 n=1 Tax=Astyanax mexicanus TaxID=7994 RepID=A0A8B9JI72_ASTMX